MEWVQVLANRISAAQDSVLDEETKSKLGLANTPGRQYQARTAHSSYMRPLSQAVPVLVSAPMY